MTATLSPANLVLENVVLELAFPGDTKRIVLKRLRITSIKGVLEPVCDGERVQFFEIEREPSPDAVVGG